MALAAARSLSSCQPAFAPSCTNRLSQSSAEISPLHTVRNTPRLSFQTVSLNALNHGVNKVLQKNRGDVKAALLQGGRVNMGLQGTGAKAKVDFVKYQGLGNDFLLVDNRSRSEPSLTPEQAAKLCDRNFGVGGDGVIFVLPGKDGADYTMRIYNSDSSEPEMCGNGIRCMAKFVADLEKASESRAYTINTLAGPIKPVLREDGQVVVDMGPPILKAADIPTTLEPTREDGSVVAAPLEVDGLTWSVTCVNMGNPHCITFGCVGSEEGLKVSEIPLAHIGPLFERNPVFPARVNTEFVEVVSRTRLKMRVWERGAGPTLACGTGACALLVAAVLEGRAERTCTVELPGGPLEIEWRQSDNHVYMTGPAEAVFEGVALVDE